MSYRSILVSIDGTRASDEALAEAIELALDSGARLTLLAVVPQVPLMAYLAPPEVSITMRFTAEDDGVAIVRQARERVPESIPLTTIIARGPVHKALANEVRRCDHDLIVVPTTRRRMMSRRERAARNRLIRESSVPVVAARA